MSYSQFIRTQEEFDHIFSTRSAVTKVRDFRDDKLNLIISSENIVGSLKPILEDMLGSEVDNLKVVLIPNAGVGTGKMQMSYEYLEQFTTINNMYLKLLDIERWPKELILESLESCDIVSFSGGMVSRLIKAIDEVGIREDLLKIFRKGKPFIGFSAGAMVMSETTNFARHFIGEADPYVADLSPLGLIDFEVYPHFEDIMLPSIKAMIPEGSNTEAYALKPTEAMVVTRGELLQAGAPIKISLEKSNAK